MNKIRSVVFIFLFAFLSNMLLTASDIELPTRSKVITVAQKVNDYWISNHSNPGNNEWTIATYFIGDIELYKVCGKQSYLDYANKWAESNQWLVNAGPSTSNADNHACGQVYIDLFLKDEVKDSTKIEAIRDAIDYRIANNPQSSDWWWIDAMFMAMPTITRLGVVYKDNKYFDKLYAMFRNTRDTLIVNSGWSNSSSITYAPGPIVTCPICGNNSDGLYNKTDGLWWRDWRYQPGVPPQNSKPKQTPNGKNIYWSRGNGWVFAALARTLELLPKNNQHRQEYIDMFLQMAQALKNCQRDDGFWNMSLGDPDYYPAAETSGTAFFTFGMAWGINNGLLDSITYYPVAAKAWNALSSIAIESSGNIKYLQNVGETPTNPSGLTTNSVNFGVGAVLLAAAEISKLAYDDGLPKDSDENGKEVLLDRTNWTITTSSVGPVDAAVAIDGDVPQYIIDGELKSAFLFVKPGKTYGGVSVSANERPFFIIDMKSVRDMSYLLYRHRDYNNSTTFLRASKASFYGKNSDEESFQPIIENFGLSTSQTEVRVNFPTKVSYRYLKFMMEGWDTTNGNTIQTSEFNIGNKVLIDSSSGNINKTFTQNSVKVFPNPINAGKPFYIHFDNDFTDASVAVYTLAGVKISECKARGNAVELKIDKQGVYIIEVKKNSKLAVLKAIIK